MLALFLVTWTPDCEKFWQSWRSLGKQAFVEQYDNRPHDMHDEIVALAQHIRPDVIVYIGAIEKYHKRHVLQVDILKRLRAIAPSVHIVSDAADKPWWEWLYKYDMEECFSVQVSIDGVFETPLADMDRGLIKLTPVDPTPYKRKSWDMKTVQCGMSGGLGHTDRLLTIKHLNTFGYLDWRKNLSFEGMAEFLSDCKVIFNHASTGTGDGWHVKGRVLEAAWAGACLLERDNPATAAWFPDDLYLKYRWPQDAQEMIEWARDNDSQVADMAQRFHEYVRERHHPRVFWNDVLAKAGVLQHAG